MTRRLVILLILLAAGLGSIFALPKTAGRQDSAIRMELPREVGRGWAGGKQEMASEKERLILAKDTDFSRRDYYRQPLAKSDTGNLEVVQTSVVLSGRDMTQSIHRPERCLDAQGWNLDSGRDVKIRLLDGSEFSVRRILCDRPLTDAPDSPHVQMLNYYWFVGHDVMTCSHYHRTVRDIKDRILHGYDQRWAYVTVSITLTGPARYLRTAYDDPAILELSPEHQEARLGITRPLSEKEGDDIVQEFIRDVTPAIVDTRMIKNWSAGE